MASGRPKKPPRRPLEGSQGCGHLFLGRKNYLSRHTTRHRKSKCQELRDSGDNPPGRRPEANRGIVWRATRRSCLTTGSFGVRELNRKKKQGYTETAIKAPFGAHPRNPMESKHNEYTRIIQAKNPTNCEPNNCERFVHRACPITSIRERQNNSDKYHSRPTHTLSVHCAGPPLNFEVELCRAGLPRWSIELVCRAVHMMDLVSCQGLFGALLGASLGPTGSILGASWRLLRPSWTVRARLEGLWGRSWAALAFSWTVLRLSWVVLGPLRALLEASGRLLGASWGSLPLGGFLGVSWGALGVPWGAFGGPLGLF